MSLEHKRKQYHLYLHFNLRSKRILQEHKSILFRHLRVLRITKKSKSTLHLSRCSDLNSNSHNNNSNSNVKERRKIYLISILFMGKQIQLIQILALATWIKMKNITITLRWMRKILFHLTFSNLQNIKTTNSSSRLLDYFSFTIWKSRRTLISGSLWKS